MQKYYSTNHECVKDQTGSYHIKKITHAKYYGQGGISCQDINRCSNEIKWQPDKETQHSIKVTQKCFRRCQMTNCAFTHKENQTRCNGVSTSYFIFIWSSTCFGWHTAHHQEPKTALAASDFAFMEGCWTCSCWTLSGRVHTLPDSVQQPHVQQPSTYAKPEAASAILGSWWWAVCGLKHVELHINMK
jgi:hypothetical protein